MAGEIQVNYSANKTLYFIVRNSIGQVWNTSALVFQAYVTASLANYTVSMTEQGTASAFYTGNFPSTISAGVYSIVAKQQLAGAAAETDPIAGAGDYQWNGAATFPLSDVATSGQLGQIGPLRMARGIAVSGFPFKLVSSADNVSPFTSGVISGQISRDGGAFQALQSGNFTEMGLGWYKVNFTSGDLLATTVAVVFTGLAISGGTCNQRDFSFVLQRTSGQ